MLACGAFMVFAVSSMQEDLYASADERGAGTGGFALYASSTFPLLEDAVLELQDLAPIVPIKVREGDDASCLNLNKAQTPTLVGVNPEALIEREAFADPALWELLNRELPNGAIPALIGDSNTAMWTLKKTGDPENGDILTYLDQHGDEVQVQLMGQLPQRLSVFQGTVVLAQKDFTRMYPGEDGFRRVLIDAEPAQAGELATNLNRRFERFGFNAIPAVERILEFYAVESTYLAMFLVLGGIGLAVGSFGMAVVVLRNLLERRGETAMIAAVGFAPSAIRRAVWWEYGILLAIAFAIAAVTALIAMAPAFSAAQSTVDTVAQWRMAVLVVVACITCLAIAVSIGAPRNRCPPGSGRQHRL